MGLKNRKSVCGFNFIGLNFLEVLSDLLRCVFGF